MEAKEDTDEDDLVLVNEKKLLKEVPTEVMELDALFINVDEDEVSVSSMDCLRRMLPVTRLSDWVWLFFEACTYLEIVFRRVLLRS